ncbi:hypothetical protein OOT46_08225 [Aquabacterium sp. A7-Y]|uniref:hypothetical protein n=1 Tax=Aquabacterium sp. A7-Y TaxID=1349605 RepID=UPI00223D6E96|nr:hypothetical protein [Aquabacterium sp. A7-Y]MCW7537833.1 hypothetical protein [Aquabacterium sp. A7-Y]
MGNLWDKLRQVREVQQAATAPAAGFQRAVATQGTMPVCRIASSLSLAGADGADTSGGPSTDALARRVDAAHSAVAAAEALLAQRLAELEARREELRAAVRSLEEAQRATQQASRRDDAAAVAPRRRSRVATT